MVRMLFVAVQTALLISSLLYVWITWLFISRIQPLSSSQVKDLSFAALCLLLSCSTWYNLINWYAAVTPTEQNWRKQNNIGEAGQFILLLPNVFKGLGFSNKELLIKC